MARAGCGSKYCSSTWALWCALTRCGWRCRLRLVGESGGCVSRGGGSDRRRCVSSPVLRARSLPMSARVATPHPSVPRSPPSLTSSPPPSTQATGTSSSAWTVRPGPVGGGGHLQHSRRQQRRWQLPLPPSPSADAVAMAPLGRRAAAAAPCRHGGSPLDGHRSRTCSSCRTRRRPRRVRGVGQATVARRRRFRPSGRGWSHPCIPAAARRTWRWQRRDAERCGRGTLMAEVARGGSQLDGDIAKTGRVAPLAGTCGSSAELRRQGKGLTR